MAGVNVWDGPDGSNKVTVRSTEESSEHIQHVYALIPRTLHDNQHTELTTDPATVVAAGAAGVKRDIAWVKIVNTTASIESLQLYDSDSSAALPDDRFEVAANSTLFHAYYPAPLKQAAAATAWSMGGGTTGVYVTIGYVESS